MSLQPVEAALTDCVPQYDVSVLIENEKILKNLTQQAGKLFITKSRKLKVRVSNLGA